MAGGCEAACHGATVRVVLCGPGQDLGRPRRPRARLRPGLSGLDVDGLRALVEPLRESAGAVAAERWEPESGRVPFVLVVPRALVGS